MGPPDGRYLLRRRGDPPSAEPAHILVMATLDAPRGRRRLGRARRDAAPQPDPTPVATGRATVIEADRPLSGSEASQWLRRAGERELVVALQVLDRVLHAYRLVTADPYLQQSLARHQALVARVGLGSGDEVADGLWTEAHELVPAPPPLRRAKVLAPQARLAAVLTGRERSLACEELTLRARLDLDQARHREAALQLLVALDAAIAELPGDPTALALAARVQELRGQRERIGACAQAALGGELSAEQREAVEFTLGRIEAALRARAVAQG